METFHAESNSEVQFQTMHGINVPEIDFYAYNKQRPISSNEVSVGYAIHRSAITFVIHI